jgi:hypothetical protein
MERGNHGLFEGRNPLSPGDAKEVKKNTYLNSQ